jgi:hypothetical protein
VWLEAGAASLAALAALLTFAEPAWLEALTGADPDNGNGSVELGLTIGLGILAITLGALARFERRRAAAAKAS